MTCNNRNITPVPAILCFFLLSPCVVSRGETFQIRLHVEEPAGVARKAWPVSGGVPLPPGRFRKDQTFALFANNGKELPCQVSPLVVDKDGTLRWILLDFQDDLAAGAAKEYVLRAAAPKALPAALTAKQTDGGVVIDTGRLQLTVTKGSSAPFAAASLAGKKVVRGGRIQYTQLHGRSGWDDKKPWQERKLQGRIEKVTLHHAGPMRVTIEASGPFADDPLGAAFTAWITSWAGRSDVQVKYVLRNSNPDQYTLIPVQQSSLVLDLAQPPRAAHLGTAKPVTVTGQAWMHQGLLMHQYWQDVPDFARAGAGAKTLWTGKTPKDKPAGWIAAGGEPNVLAVDRHFATDPARRLALDKGHLVLEGIAERFTGPKDAKFKQDRRVGQPWQSEARWLFDCSHHTSEYYIDFDAPSDPAALDKLAKASKARLWVRAEPDYYSACQAVATSPFGTLADEKACYRKWGWTWQPNQEPRPDPARCQSDAFVAWEDNHYESEADSVQGLLLMYLRTGDRRWFNQAESWARYHMDLQAWRTDGWRWKDGAIWFPQGGPLGTKPQRKKWHFTWGAHWGARKDSADCADLWRQTMGKSCYCHFYGSGLVDWYCLTGDPDALAAAVDNVEQKDSEFRRHRNFIPGKSAIASIRGFGRGFEVMMRVLQADPGNQFVEDLAHLCARTLWQSPLLDERGFHCSRIGQMPAKDLSPATRTSMAARGITFKQEGGNVTTISKDGKTWPVRAMGGTWQHIYIQNAAELYARQFDDENMRDFTVAFAHMSAKFMLSPKCHQTWYYAYLDVPELGRVYDPWAFDHTSTTNGEGCVHSGYYTRHYVDACAKGFSFTGEPALLRSAREFWYYGSKRRYQTKGLHGGKNGVGLFVGHYPPKDDTVLEAARLLYEGSHPRSDSAPPAAVKDLRVKRLAGGKAEVSFTAPADAGGGKAVRYQVKCAAAPIVAYEDFDYARDAGRKRNWWRAVNCDGEPAPGEPGTKERFIVTGAPADGPVYFAVRTFDTSSNRSGMSNVAKAR